jgi:hypothetical protein
MYVSIIYIVGRRKASHTQIPSARVAVKHHTIPLTPEPTITTTKTSRMAFQNVILVGVQVPLPSTPPS